MEKKVKSLNVGNLKRLAVSYNSVAIFLLLLIAATFFVNKFDRNYATVLVESSFYGCIAIGLALVMITGNIDLSVGFQAATSAVITVLMLQKTGSVPVAIAVALVAGIIMGAINGFVVTKLGISALIATIATNYIFKGFVYYFTKDGSIYPEGELRNALKVLAGTRIADLKFLTFTVIIIVAILIFLTFVLHKTKFGNNMYIAGDNAEAGKLAGINITRSSFIAYVICGFLCALAGVFLSSSQGAAIYTLGEGRDVFAVSACVIGGIKMAGGKGNMLNVLVGVLIMRIISTSMNLMLLPTAWVDFVSGALLIVVLIIDRFTSTKKED